MQNKCFQINILEVREVKTVSWIPCAKWRRSYESVAQSVKTKRCRVGTCLQERRWGPVL